MTCVFAELLCAGRDKLQLRSAGIGILDNNQFTFGFRNSLMCTIDSCWAIA